MATAAFTLLLVLCWISREKAPMDFLLSCGAASFPSRACIGCLGSGLLVIVKSLPFQEMPWTEPTLVFNIKESNILL